MKHTKTLANLFAAMLVATVFCGNNLFADFDVRKIQDSFVNGGKEFFFTYKEDSQGDILTSANGKDDVDIAAYNTQFGRSGSVLEQTYFRTFCIEPDSPAVNKDNENEILVGTLNYVYDESEWVTQTSSNVELSLGAAVLYKEFAVGTRSTGDSLKESLREAILVLLSIRTIRSWADNDHLAYLWSIIPDAGAWTVNYDPSKYNALIGDYCVFVLNVVSSDDTLSAKDQARQDFLYIAKVNTSTDVPEPASLLLWTLGGIGVAAASWGRKRRMKKLAAA